MPRFVRLAAVVALLASWANQVQGQIPWAADLAQAQKTATDERKLLLLHFYNDHCEPCARVEQNVFSQPQVAAAIGRNYVPVKIHAGQQQRVAEHYRVDRWPTDVVCTASGLEIMRTASPQKPDQFVGLVDQVALQAGVGAGRQWASTMQGLGQEVARQPAQTVQTLTTQAAATAEGYAGQANAALQGYGQQAQAAVEQGQAAVQQGQATAQQWNQRATAATQQVNNTAQQLGNSAQQMGGLVQNTTRDLRSAWDPAALRPPASAAVAAPQPSIYQTAPPAAGSASVAVAPPASEGVATTLPTANPWIGQQAGAAPQQPAQQVVQQPAQQPVRSQDWQRALPGGTAPAAPPAAPSPSLTADQGLVPASQAPPTALEGYCAVTLLENRKWRKADPQFGAIHRGRTYLFASEAEQRKFLSNPDGYSPVLSGLDPVIFAQRGEQVEGKRSYGLTYNKQIFLFAEEASLKAFEQSPQAFAGAAYQAMQQTESSPLYR